MNEIKCSGQGCLNVFRTTEPVAKNATYTCRDHTGKVEKGPHFQQHANDRELGSSVGKKPAHE